MAETDKFRGWPIGIADNRALACLLGVQDHLTVDASTADYNVSETWQNCRAISCDTAGIVKLDYKTDFGETKTVVMQISAGQLFQLRNVTKVYRYYKPATAITAEIYKDSDGQSSAGIRLHR